MKLIEEEGDRLNLEPSRILSEGKRAVNRARSGCTKGKKS